MTNRELLQAPEHLISELDRQRLFLLRVDGTPLPCPACKKSVSAIEATGLDLDSFDCDATRHTYRCPACSAELEQIIPAFTGGCVLWHWQLKEIWLQAQLQKARSYEQQSRSKDNDAA